MNPKKILLACVAGVLFASVAGYSQGGTRPPEKTPTGRFGDPTGIARQYQSYISGVIKKIGKHEMVLEKTRFGVDTTIKLAPKTKYIHNEKPGKLDDLKAGDLVFVDVKKDKKTGEMSAKKVVSGVTPIS
jgi:hypothetical protein